MSRRVAITPDLEYIAYIALDPDVDQLWLFCLRGRIVF
jgi:hypothetical protein